MTRGQRRRRWPQSPRCWLPWLFLVGTLANKDGTTAADEAHTIDQPFDDACCCLGISQCDRFRSLDEPTGDDRNERECPQPGASFIAFAIPAYR